MRCPRVPHPGNTAQFGTVPKTGGENRIGINIHPPLMLLLLSFTSATFCTEKGNTRSLGARSSMPECRSKQSPKNALLRQRTPFRSSSKARTNEERWDHEAVERCTEVWNGCADMRHLKERDRPRGKKERRGETQTPHHSRHEHTQRKKKTIVGVSGIGAEGASLEGK